METMTADEIVTDLVVLRQVSKPTSSAEVKALKLLERLKAAVKTSWTPGMGLAAIQIGVPLQFGWFTVEGKDFTLMNPRILQYHAPWKLKAEGCLSIPNSYAGVKRAEGISYLNHGEKFKAFGDMAHVIQHEVDHMHGTLNIDREED